MDSHDGKTVHEVSLRQLFKANLVIPEIQREYVWGNPEIGKRVLEPFFTDFLKGVDEFAQHHGEMGKQERSLSEYLRKSLAEFGIQNACRSDVGSFANAVLASQSLAKGKCLDSKIGFVYAYIPGFAKDGRGNTLAFLIDGQQRVTTFFLLWLYLAHHAEKRDDFKTATRLCKTGMALDFKVRPQTHEFLLKLVNHVVDDQEFDFSSIEDCLWFLSDYHNDVSIVSISNALRVWDNLWRRSKQDAAVAYDYLTNHVKFWLFVMNEASQGEQLYITMNGRGKSLSEDEIIRAKVFRDAIEKKIKATEVGTLFESIEDFFWVHRITGELTADKGKRKFFRWVYLLDRYGKTPIKREDGTDVDGFSEALRNDKDKKFKLEESMFGYDEKSKSTRVSFKLIKDVLAALELVYGEAWIDVSKYLRESVLREADDGPAFQQDAFVVLPLLRWIIGVRGLGREPSVDVARWFVRYLRKMATKSDVRKNPSDAVPHAMKFAVEFVEFQSTEDKDFLDFIHQATALDGGKRISLMLLPEEEIYKAKRLLEVRNKDKDLYLKFVKLIEEVEDYKSTKEKKGLEADYRIGAFLSLKADWAADPWGPANLTFYCEAFRKFKAFWESPTSLAKMEFLMTPEVGGYYDWRAKILPYTLVDLFSNTDAVKKIVNFQARIEREGFDAVYDDFERKFLCEHWAKVSQEVDVCVLGAIGLIVHRLSSGRHEVGWTKLQYHDKYHDSTGYCSCPQGKRALGPRGLFFWFFDDTRTNWSDTVMVADRILAGNEDRSEKLVSDFLLKRQCKMDGVSAI